MKKRFTEELVVRMLREAETSGMPIREFRRKQNINEQTFFRWRNKHAGMDVSDARRLMDLASENAKLKRLVAQYALRHRRSVAWWAAGEQRVGLRFCA